jgi:hypothetical protein
MGRLLCRGHLNHGLACAATPLRRLHAIAPAILVRPVRAHRLRWALRTLQPPRRVLGAMGPYLLNVVRIQKGRRVLT